MKYVISTVVGGKQPPRPSFTGNESISVYFGFGGSGSGHGFKPRGKSALGGGGGGGKQPSNLDAQAVNGVKKPAGETVQPTAISKQQPHPKEGYQEPEQVSYTSDFFGITILAVIVLIGLIKILKKK